jgi:protocatechuate 3,4-dioxygenase beta subunit
MLLDRIRSAAVLAVAMLGVAGTSVGLVMLPKQKPGRMPPAPGMTPPAKDAQAKAAGPPTPSPADLRKAAAGLLGAIRGQKELSYKGVVVDPAGRPVAGARVYLLFVPGSEVPKTKSGPDGRFAFAANVGPGGMKPRVAAEADGYALGGASQGFAAGDTEDGPTDDGRELTVKLVDDQPVEGRVVDLEGRPVAGADVRIEYLFVPKNGDLEPYLRALRDQEDAPDHLRNQYLWHSGLHPMRRKHFGEGVVTPPSEATTDAQGRFVLKGIGRDRLVNLRIEGPGIRPLDIHVITRPGEPIRVPNMAREPRFGMRTFYGASLRLAASPSRPIEGFIRDRETGAPVAGATVSSYKLADQNLGNNTIVQAKSDAKGHYRLAGMPRGSGNEVMIIPPAGSPYLQAKVELDDPPGLGPIAFDIPLYRGVEVEGRVVDEGTGKPVKAWATYHVAVDNPALESAPAYREMQYAQSYLLKAGTDAQGRFKLVAFPGRGLLAVETMDRSHPDDGQSGFRQDFVPIVQMFHQAVAEIDIPRDAKTFQKEIRLDPGRVVEGTVVDQDGKPVEDAEVYGLGNLGYWETLTRISTFKVVALVASRPARALVFRHEGRKLAGWIEVQGGETGHPRVKLEPWAAATGRLVDAGGKPLAGLTLSVYANKPRLGGSSISHQPEHVRTDADGRFRVEGLAPGLGYHVYVQAPAGMRAEKTIDIQPTKPGETRELGNVAVAYRNLN